MQQGFSSLRKLHQERYCAEENLQHQKKTSLLLPLAGVPEAADCCLGVPHLADQDAFPSHLREICPFIARIDYHLKK